MKLLFAFLGFVLGVLMTAGVCRLYYEAKAIKESSSLSGSVHAPLSTCLDDIVATLDRGDTKLAEQKIRLLQKRWDQYMSGGQVPGQFYDEILELGKPKTQPTTRP